MKLEKIIVEENRAKLLEILGQIFFLEDKALEEEFLDSFNNLPKELQTVIVSIGLTDISKHWKGNFFSPELPESSAIPGTMFSKS